jgi:hypothetical protein
MPSVWWRSGTCRFHSPSNKQNACIALSSAQCRQIKFFEIEQPGWGYVTTVFSVVVL